MFELIVSQGVALRIFCCPFRALQWREGGKSSTQGVGFADVFSGTAESKQALTLRMPKENVALSYVLLTLRGGSPLSGGLTFCPIN